MEKGKKHTEETKAKISESAKDNAGRPTLYKSEYDEQVYKLCLLGMIDTELAKFFGVTEQTLNNWKLEHESFFESIKRGKEIADGEVVQALYKRAVGFEYDSVKIFQHQGEEVIIPYKEYIIPDVTAQKKWLSARQRKVWSESLSLNGGQDENGEDKEIIFKVVK